MAGNVEIDPENKLEIRICAAKRCDTHPAENPTSKTKTSGRSLIKNPLFNRINPPWLQGKSVAILKGKTFAKVWGLQVESRICCFETSPLLS